MRFFKKKVNDLPLIDLQRCEPVLRCSICTGEQVLCTKDRETGDVHELMLVRSRCDLEDVCEANGIDAEAVRKIY